MKKVITYGTFDLHHDGHLKLLERIKKDNNYLIVALSTNKFNRKKNKKSVDSFKIRKQNLLKTGLVDKIIKEKKWNQKMNDIRKYEIDEFYMGDDWKNKFNYLKKICKVTYLKRTDGISTTILKSKL